MLSTEPRPESKRSDTELVTNAGGKKRLLGRRRGRIATVAVIGPALKHVAGTAVLPVLKSWIVTAGGLGAVNGHTGSEDLQIRQGNL